MGSHYIQVGKLKIDQDLMDVICPAAGYTPELICPAAGYILEPGQPYVPIINIGTPDEEEIWLLCQKTGFGVLWTQINVSGGQWYMEVYDSNNNIVYVSDNKNSGNNFFYSFEGNEGDYFIVKYKLTGAYSFTQWKVYQSSTYNGADYPILQAKFNTPNLTSLANAFQYVLAIRDIQLISTMENLTTMASCFYGSGLQYFKPSKAFTSLTTMASCFYNSLIEIIDLSDSTFPALSLITSLCQNATFLYRMMFPPSLPELTNASAVLSGAVSLKILNMFTSAPKVTTYANFLINANNLTGSLTVPEAENCTTIASFARYCYKIESLIFLGDMPSLSNATTLADNAISLQELQLPKIVGTAPISYGIVSNCNNLKILKLYNYSYQINQFAISALKPKIEEFHGDLETPASVSSDFNYPYRLLKVINMPKARFYRILIGTSTSLAPVNFIDIDWSNCVFNSTYSPSCISLYCQLDAAEINRIFTLLPIVSGSYGIDVRFCPGYTSCNPSIATAKGWTVL